MLCAKGHDFAATYPLPKSTKPIVMISWNITAFDANNQHNALVYVYLTSVLRQGQFRPGTECNTSFFTSEKMFTKL